MKTSRDNIILFFLLQVLTAFFSLSLAQTDPSPYGINAHVPNSQMIHMISEVGIKWIRVDFPWNQIEPEDNYFNWQIFDDVANEAKSKGLSILANLGGTPPWANNGDGVSVPPLKKEDWVNFVHKIVSRYKNKVKYWQMWNEPNLGEFWKGSLDEYVDKILIPGAEAAKAVDPSCRIVGPDLAHLHSQEAQWNIWLRAILRKGGREQLDVISHHIYDRRGPIYIFDKLENDQAPLIPSVQRVLQEEGVDNKPFWITETGWDTDEVGEEVQSSYYLGFLQGMRDRPFINKIFFYEIIDDLNPDIPSFGIIYSDYTPKEAYYTYKDFIAGKYPPEEPSSPDNEDEWCPIVTLLKGKENSQEKISYLIHVRDTVLKTTIRGNRLVNLYYKFAPEINLILLNSPYSCKLASDCLEPFISVSKEMFLKGIESLEDRFLSEEEVKKAKEFIEILRYNASPGLKEILNSLEKELSFYKKKPLNKLILDLDFDSSILREEKNLDK